MKFALATILGTIAISNAKLGTHTRRLKPENAGAYHTDAFEQLAEKYSKATPQGQLDIMKDISEIVAEYCPIGNKECRSGAYRATMKQFHKVSQGLKPFEAPKEMDPKLADSLQRTFDIISDIDELSVEFGVKEMKKIQDEISEMKGVDEAHQMIGVAALSVAQESALYWNNAFQDEDHPFQKLWVDDNKRKLQVTGNLTFSDIFPLDMPTIIDADVQGAIDFSIEEVNAQPNLVFNFAELLLALIAGAIPASAAVAFNVNHTST